MPDPTPVTWPWTGREPELAAIAAARADPGCPGVVVGRPPARASRASAARRRRRRARRRADGVGAGDASAAIIPLGAFARLLPEDVADGRHARAPARVRRPPARARRRAAGRRRRSTTPSCSIRPRPRSCCTWRPRRPRSSSRRCARASRARTRSSRCGRTAARSGSSSAPRASPARTRWWRRRSVGPCEEEVQRWVLERSRGQPAVRARARARRARRQRRLVAERGLWRLRGGRRRWPPRWSSSSAAAWRADRTSSAPRRAARARRSRCACRRDRRR